MLLYVIKGLFKYKKDVLLSATPDSIKKRHNLSIISCLIVHKSDKTKLFTLPPPENHSAPPDVTGYSSDSSHSHTERHHMANMGTIARNTQKYGNAERMETGDGKSRHRVERRRTFSLRVKTPKTIGQK